MRITIEPTGGDAPFEQLRRQVAEQAADGTLPPGHKLPTVRALAAGQQDVVAGRGVGRGVETHGRAGTFIASRRLHDPATDTAARDYVLLARRQGLSRDEAIRLVERFWT
jgi:DNA-binding transcriptional regulator YhcF (GntR family)